MHENFFISSFRTCISSIIIKLYFPAIIAIHFSCLLAFNFVSLHKKSSVFMTTFDNSCHRKTKTNRKFIPCDGMKWYFSASFFSLLFLACNKIKFVGLKCRNCAVPAQESKQQSTFYVLCELNRENWKWENKLHKDECLV